MSSKKYCPVKIQAAAGATELYGSEEDFTKKKRKWKQDRACCLLEKTLVALDVLLEFCHRRCSRFSSTLI